MSEIFDALHRSAAERSKTDLMDLAAAADLLEAAERQVAQDAAQAERQAAQHPARAEKQVPQETTQAEPPAQKEQLGPGEFPRVPALVSNDSNLVCITEEASLAAEKFRFLGVRLRHLQQTHPLKRLLITSAMAEEGKTTVAGNLAFTLAKRQLQRTLLLEGDLRRPSLTERFGLAKMPGLSELLQGESSPTLNIYQLEGLGFWILPAGSPPESPLEFMQSGKLPLLMDELSSRFDWIVIDSPPVLPLADTSVWMRLADAVLLVTRPGKTAKRQLQRALEAVEQSKLLGALVNGSKEAVLGDYYHYHYRSIKTAKTPAGDTAETHADAQVTA